MTGLMRLRETWGQETAYHFGPDRAEKKFIGAAQQASGTAVSEVKLAAQVWSIRVTEPNTPGNVHGAR